MEQTKGRKKARERKKTEEAAPEGQVPEAPALMDLLAMDDGHKQGPSSSASATCVTTENRATAEDLDPAATTAGEKNEELETKDADESQSSLENPSEEAERKKEKERTARSSTVEKAGSSTGMVTKTNSDDVGAAPIPKNVQALEPFAQIPKMMSDPLSASTSMYPTVAPLSSATLGFQIPQICIQSEPTDTVPHYPDLKNEAGMAIPSRAKLVEMAASSSAAESELLSEQQLLEYYQNEQLEFVDDFVDVFIQQEIEPRNCLYELLEAYREACKRVQAAGDLKTETVEQLHRVNNLVWTVTEHRVTHQVGNPKI